MRVVPWFLGFAFGLIACGAVLVAGFLALLLLVPAVVWAARERARPLGLGGLVIGLGVGMAGLLGLIALASARCADSDVSGPISDCGAPDLTPYLVAATALAVIGAGVSLAGLVRRRPAGI
jgi:hypothetical protein